MEPPTAYTPKTERPRIKIKSCYKHTRQTKPKQRLRKKCLGRLNARQKLPKWAKRVIVLK